MVPYKSNLVVWCWGGERARATDLCRDSEPEGSSEQAQEMVCKDLSHSSEGMRGREGGKQPHIGGRPGWGSRSLES